MYPIKVFDDTVPYYIRKAAYDYCYTQRWYAGYRQMPPLDMVPLTDKWDESSAAQPHRSISRAPFASEAKFLAIHKPIERLFNHINKYTYDGKLVLDGFSEKSPGLKYTPVNQQRGDVMLTNKVAFSDVDDPELAQEWRQDIIHYGARAYLQCQPYETHRVSRSPHRDYGVKTLSDEYSNHFTLMYVANMEWKPEWMGEFTMYADADEDTSGPEYKDLKMHKGVGIGYPNEIIDNVPGRIVVQDARQLHATRAVGETAPEASMHINFRVTVTQ